MSKLKSAEKTVSGHEMEWVMPGSHKRSRAGSGPHGWLSLPLSPPETGVRVALLGTL